MVNAKFDAAQGARELLDSEPLKSTLLRFGFVQNLSKPGLTFEAHGIRLKVDADSWEKKIVFRLGLLNDTADPRSQIRVSLIDVYYNLGGDFLANPDYLDLRDELKRAMAFKAIGEMSYFVFGKPPILITRGIGRYRDFSLGNKKRT